MQTLLQSHILHYYYYIVGGYQVFPDLLIAPNDVLCFVYDVTYIWHLAPDPLAFVPPEPTEEALLTQSKCTNCTK